MKILDLMQAMEAIAPLDLAELWDNPGLLVGAPEDALAGVMLCVDATHALIDQAQARGCNCILAHHPLMFAGTKNLRSDHYEGGILARLLRGGLSMFAAHTNLDRAPGGVEDSLAQALSIKVDACTPYVRAGTVDARTAGQWLAHVRGCISPQAVFYGDAGRSISRVGVSCGGGGEYFHQALEMGADVFLTGEMKHHERIEAQGLGLCVIIAGHEETERVVLQPLAETLRKALDVPIFVSGS